MQRLIVCAIVNIVTFLHQTMLNFSTNDKWNLSRFGGKFANLTLWYVPSHCNLSSFMSSDEEATLNSDKASVYVQLAILLHD